MLEKFLTSHSCVHCGTGGQADRRSQGSVESQRSGEKREKK